MAIQKRYEYWSSENGKPTLTWTSWFDYSPNDSLLKVFQKEGAWQLRNKLRNEFRIKPE